MQIRTYYYFDTPDSRELQYILFKSILQALSLVGGLQLSNFVSFCLKLCPIMLVSPGPETSRDSIKCLYPLFLMGGISAREKRDSLFPKSLSTAFVLPGSESHVFRNRNLRLTEWRTNVLNVPKRLFLSH